MSSPFASLPMKRPSKTKKQVVIPTAVLNQRALRKKHNYIYRQIGNGNIENNSTLYVSTDLAHYHQIEKLFMDALAKAKAMPEIFGKDFECNIQINLIRKHTGQYMGYAFVDVDNPKFYYALIGCNVNGTDRVDYIPDPAWVPPAPRATQSPRVLSWAEETEEIEGIAVPSPPNIRIELPPLLILGRYQYDEQQLAHNKQHGDKKNETTGSMTISPAYITPGVSDDHDDTKLYVSHVPESDYDFLYAIFSRYARYESSDESDHRYYPKITIHKNTEKMYAIVQYAHPYDVKFAVTMLRKIRAQYHNQDINMSVRAAFKNRH